MKIGFIGLGHMGSAMAANLIKKGHEVVVFNRTAEKAAPLVAQGAKAVSNISELAPMKAVFTMLSNDDAVEEVSLGENGLVAHLSDEAIHVCTSTISVDLSDRMAEQHAIRRQHYVAAPVFGRPDSAAAGKLFVITAGNPQALDVVKPLFEAFAQRTFTVSDRCSSANLVKLTGNFLIASVIESLGEALAIAEKSGINRNKCLEILTSTLFTAPIYNTYGKLIVERQFKPGFGVPLAQKDIRLLLGAAEALNVTLPFASVLRDRFLSLMAHGGENLDWSALGGMAAKDAGLM